MFCDYYLFLASFIVDRARCKWTVRSAVGVNIAWEWLIYCCVFTLSVNLKFGNFTLSFCRLRQRIILKFVQYVQHVQHVLHDNFSSFSQWGDCFLALSSLPLPSSLLQLPRFHFAGTLRDSVSFLASLTKSCELSRKLNEIHPEYLSSAYCASWLLMFRTMGDFIVNIIYYFRRKWMSG